MDAVDRSTVYKNVDSRLGSLTGWYASEIRGGFLYYLEFFRVKVSRLRAQPEFIPPDLHISEDLDGEKCVSLRYLGIPTFVLDDQKVRMTRTEIVDWVTDSSLAGLELLRFNCDRYVPWDFTASGGFDDGGWVWPRDEEMVPVSEEVEAAILTYDPGHRGRAARPVGADDSHASITQRDVARARKAAKADMEVRHRARRAANREREERDRARKAAKEARSGTKLSATAAEFIPRQ